MISSRLPRLKRGGGAGNKVGKIGIVLSQITATIPDYSREHYARQWPLKKAPNANIIPKVLAQSAGIQSGTGTI